MSFFFFLKNAGPIPIENSFILTLKNFATEKCPSSWTTIIIPNNNKANNIGHAFDHIDDADILMRIESRLFITNHLLKKILFLTKFSAHSLI